MAADSGRHKNRCWKWEEDEEEEEEERGMSSAAECDLVNNEAIAT